MDVVTLLLQRVNRTAADGWTVQLLSACRTLSVQFSLVVWPDANERCSSQSPSQVNYSIDPVPGHYQWGWCCHKLLNKAYQKLQGIQDIPSQRVIDLEASIRQLRQLSCILDSCTISASYEVSQAQKALLLLPHTGKGASTSSEELNPQISPCTDEEHNLPYHEDYWQEY